MYVCVSGSLLACAGAQWTMSVYARVPNVYGSLSVCVCLRTLPATHVLAYVRTSDCVCMLAYSELRLGVIMRMCG